MMRVAADARTRLFRVFAGVLLGLFFACAGAVSASAHAELRETTPEDGAVVEQAPAAAELVFNEPVQLIADGIRLFSPGSPAHVLDARIVDSRIVVDLPDAVGEGVHALAYRVVSADGHPITGAISFQVGAAGSVAEAPQLDHEDATSTDSAVGIATGLQYLGLLTLSGLVFFQRFVRREGFSTRVVRAVSALAGGAVVASIALVPLSAARVAGVPLAALADVGRWVPGLLWPPAVAAAMVAVFGVLLFVLVRLASPAAQTLAVLAATAALAAPVLIGHSQTLEPRWLALLADGGHLAAAAFWLGGLVALLLSAGSREEPVHAAGIVARFSSFALVSVGVLALSGVGMALLILDRPDELLGTGWGRTLLLKIGVLLPVVALALWNRTRLLPRVIELSGGGDERGSSAAWSALGRVLRAEAALLVAVVLITGSLSNTSPGHGAGHAGHGAASGSAASAGPLTVEAQSQGLTVAGTLTPGATGANEVRFRLEYQGEALEEAAVEVLARLPEQHLGPLTLVPEWDEAAAEYRAAVTLPASGAWTLEISARASTYAQPIAVVTVDIP